VLITVFLATRNRALSLREVLESYRALISPDPWKIVIVDNGSNDATKDVIDSFTGCLPIEYVAEPRPGKTIALNTGISRIEGDLILLTDDDMVPCADWLQHFRRAATDQPDYAVFAGAVTARWPSPPDPWAVNNLRILCGAFAVSVPDLADGPLLDCGLVRGGNFAVRTPLIHEFRFDSEIGPRGTNFYMGSETEFLVRVAAAGYKMWWTGSAVAQHIIRPEQLSKNWVLKRAVRLGRGGWRQVQAFDNSIKWFGVPRWLFRQFGTEALLCARETLFWTEESAFAAKFNFITIRSLLAEGWRSKHKPPPRPEHPESRQRWDT
jgi:glycosyltransferase involved in cell wall biosynthesis